MMLLPPPAPYVLLMASLPALGPLLGQQDPPITRTRLMERLRLLTPADQAELHALDAGLAWTRRAMGETDAAYLAGVDALMAQIARPAVRDALRDRLEIRTLMAALRRRQAGEPVPEPGEAWGYGRFVGAIRLHWSKPDFALTGSFPWIRRAVERLRAGDYVGLERTVLEASWDAAIRRGAGHSFDFEAVALYFIRWSLMDRWARYDVAAATARFSAMLDEALAGEAVARAAGEIAA